MPRALVSVSDKTNIVEFAQRLAALGWELVSTGGTAQALERAGLAVTPVSAVTGFAEMLDGRVKTLHPAIFGGILARRARNEDMSALAEQEILPIDLVAVNLYPFARAAAELATPFDDLIEQIDIGGPSLIRAAAKNFDDVLVLVDPADYAPVAAALGPDVRVSHEIRLALARKAFAHTAAYDAMIATTLDQVCLQEERFVRDPTRPRDWPASLALGLTKRGDLRYGENPHQRAAWYAQTPAWGLGAGVVLQGKELSYTNLLDVDAAVRLALEFDEPAAIVIKHTNACGVATGESPARAYVAARDADALSAFGGIVGLNRPLDGETARAIVSTFVEAVVAPGVQDEARPILASKQNMRVVVVDFGSVRAAADRMEVRSVLGGLLVQERDRVTEADAAWDTERSARGAFKVVTRREPSADEWKALRFAWRVCAHVKSNAVIFTGPDRTLAVGAGQMSRVDAVNVAVMKAGRSLVGSVAASDAFFPFRDGMDAVARAGATAIVQPGGSVRDKEVIEAADEHGLAMVFTGRRHFRH